MVVDGKPQRRNYTPERQQMSAKPASPKAKKIRTPMTDVAALPDTKALRTAVNILIKRVHALEKEFDNH
jgi:hypothetical protein